MRLSPTCATHADDAPARSADAVVAMPRSSLESAIADGNLPVGEAKGGLETVGFEAERGFERKGPGAVLVRARRVVDECLDGIHGLPRRDLAGDVAAHAVGDDEQSDVGPFAMTVFIAGATQTLVRRNGPAERQRTRGAHGRRQPCVRTCLSAPVRGEMLMRDDTWRRLKDLVERDARAFVIDV